MEPSAPRPKVVVTGLGLVTPLGIGIEPFWSALIAGQAGVRNISRFDTSGLPVTVAAEVHGFAPEEFMDQKDVRRTDLFVQFAVVATMLALKDAQFTIDAANAERVGVLIGSGFGGLTTLLDQHKVLLERGPDRVSPVLIPMMIPDMASGYVSILTGAKGPNSTVVTACATGANAIGDGAEIIRRGKADVMLVGGTEAALHPLGIAGFANSRALASKFNDDPARASRPFDAHRDGFVMGEGAGVLILESEAHALARGAHIYGEVAGYGMSGDAHHIVQPAPDGNGVARAIQAALDDAGITRDQVEYINAHATSTQAGDRGEVHAFQTVFGDELPPISSTKGGTGHMLGAAGAVEAAVCLLALERGILPPTINQEFPDPEITVDVIPNVAREKQVKVAVSNNSGFGGHNAVLVFRRP